MGIQLTVAQRFGHFFLLSLIFRHFSNVGFSGLLLHIIGDLMVCQKYRVGFRAGFDGDKPEIAYKNMHAVYAPSHNVDN
uniref:Uncharacterized protein n=1 Tax=Ixodes scapularis TaxID=6945 RepID=A0A4D5S796_IXOSC